MTTAALLFASTVVEGQAVSSKVAASSAMSVAIRSRALRFAWTARPNVRSRTAKDRSSCASRLPMSD